jgi:quercetin 2,3-dioxygenase
MNDMIKIIKSNEHYHNEEEDWFSTYWHFSFAHYQDPHKMNFGPLRIFNDDVIQPATGFDFHPHRDMEIITYVSEGKLEHRYNQGNHDVIHPGDEVQRMMMTAGSGILHSQYNRSKDKPLRLLQMWIFPSKRELEPSWEQRQFEKQGRANKLLPVVMPENAKEDGPALHMHQDGAIYVSYLTKEGSKVEHALALERKAYLFVIDARAQLLNGSTIETRGAAKIEKEGKLSIQAEKPTELILLDLPEKYAINN